MRIEVRYERSFLTDLQQLNVADHQRVYEFVFGDFLQLNQWQTLPGLRQMGERAIFYRFSLYDYLIAIEVTGDLVKFLRILPKPTLEDG